MSLYRKGVLFMNLPDMFQEWEKQRDRVNFIKGALSEASLYEQLAEECVELAHACQKKARKLRDENPTPMKTDEIDKNVVEEYTDVRLVAHLLNIDVDAQLYWEKSERWTERLS